MYGRRGKLAHTRVPWFMRPLLPVDRVTAGCDADRVSKTEARPDPRPRRVLRFADAEDPATDQHREGQLFR